MASRTFKVEIEHPGAHEPDAESFKQRLGAGYAKEAKAADVKRVTGTELTIEGYTQTSGVSTVYNVAGEVEPVATEPEPAAKGK